MTRFISSAEKFNYIVPSGGVKSDDVVIAGGLVGVAMSDGEEGDTIACLRSGIFRFPKAAGAIEQGAEVKYQSGQVSTSAGDTIGVAANKAGAEDTTVDVVLGAGV